MKQPPLDSETHALATKVIANAPRRGQDPVEALYRAGLLATPAGDRALQVEGAESVLIQLSRHSVADFLRYKYQGNLARRTQQDLYNSIVEWLEEYVKELRKP